MQDNVYPEGFHDNDYITVPLPKFKASKFSHWTTFILKFYCSVSTPFSLSLSFNCFCTLYHLFTVCGKGVYLKKNCIRWPHMQVVSDKKLVTRLNVLPVTFFRTGRNKAILLLDSVRNAEHIWSQNWGWVPLFTLSKSWWNALTRKHSAKCSAGVSSCSDTASSWQISRGCLQSILFHTEISCGGEEDLLTVTPCTAQPLSSISVFLSELYLPISC